MPVRAVHDVVGSKGAQLLPDDCNSHHVLSFVRCGDSCWFFSVSVPVVWLRQS